MIFNSIPIDYSQFLVTYSFYNDSLVLLRFVSTFEVCSSYRSVGLPVSLSSSCTMLPLFVNGLLSWDISLVLSGLATTYVWQVFLSTSTSVTPSHSFYINDFCLVPFKVSRVVSSCSYNDALTTKLSLISPTTRILSSFVFSSEMKTGSGMTKSEPVSFEDNF